MQYNIVFSSDQNYIAYLLVTVQSIINSLEKTETDSQDQLIFHVLTDESVSLDAVQQQSQNFLQKNSSCPVQCSFVFHYVDKSVFESFSPWFADNGAQQSSRSTYYRLIIDKVLPKNISKVLYLDIDILVLKDIRCIFHYDLHNNVIGGARDLTIFLDYIDKKADFLRSKQNPAKKLYLDTRKYVNAGILLIDFAKWQEQRIGERCMELAKEYDAALRDQDLINYTAQDNIEFLDLAWNCSIRYYDLNHNKQNNTFSLPKNMGRHLSQEYKGIETNGLLEALASPKILHCIGLKPWYALQPDETKNIKFFVTKPQALHYMEQWASIAVSVEEFVKAHPNAGSKLLGFIAVAPFLKQQQQALEQRIHKNRKKINALVAGITCLFLLNLIMLFLSI